MKIVLNKDCLTFIAEKKPRALEIQWFCHFSWWYPFFKLDFIWTGITCAHEIWEFEFFIFKFLGINISYTKDECEEDE